MNETRKPRYATVIVLRDGTVRKYRNASANAAHVSVRKHREMILALGTAHLYVDSYATLNGQRIPA